MPVSTVSSATNCRYTPCGVDPKEVHGEDFPGETFRVLKEKEIKQFRDAPLRMKISFE
jgi:hypothetical protein